MLTVTMTATNRNVMAVVMGEEIRVSSNCVIAALVRAIRDDGLT